MTLDRHSSLALTLCLIPTLGACAAASAQRSQTLVASATTLPGSPSRANAAGPRHIIRTAQIELTHDAFERQANMARAEIKRLGGHVAQADTSERQTRITFRVPVASFAQAVVALKKLGEIEAVRVRGDDVTAQVVDLTLRLQNLIEARKRYLELLAKAQSVTEALLVQQQLLKGKLKLIREEVRLSTIELIIEKPLRPGVVGWVFVGLYKGVRWLFVWD
ncbi:MAG: DUF4349 domain-containing protein [Deltaproteobacteria bacterium]|nr:DUF4349 domain-containing protein [Deltaproteobacteria bacterium]